MGKRGELKDMDGFEEGVRQSAVQYNVVLFQPRKPSLVSGTFKDLGEAQTYSRDMLSEQTKVRSAMIYAIDESDHHALVGTITLNMKLNLVIPEAHK